MILTRIETSPEDVDGMHAASGILTARGGMTSHAALVARGWGKCCIVGCGDLDCDEKKKSCLFNGIRVNSGDYISIDGYEGSVFFGEIGIKETRAEGTRIED